jgi:hypothetical protein
MSVVAVAASVVVAVTSAGPFVTRKPAPYRATVAACAEIVATATLPEIAPSPIVRASIVELTAVPPAAATVTPVEVVIDPSKAAVTPASVVATVAKSPALMIPPVPPFACAVACAPARFSARTETAPVAASATPEPTVAVVAAAAAVRVAVDTVPLRPKIDRPMRRRRRPPCCATRP